MREELINWITKVGDELVIEAMKRALDRNKVSWGYVRGILRDWVNKGIIIVLKLSGLSIILK
ncbi:DnaD domain protein [Salinibacillus xinjiangensis]|uniref:DnaD domain protein n=2 Tax=Salinibacillus xinjiangensis TaxID=1229268 RepID=A0A6G1X9R2_9BACI|nr:DnaD domain protein [Salinibacillus xinjiangensis]